MGIGENVEEMKKANRKKGVRNTQSQKSQRECGKLDCHNVGSRTLGENGRMLNLVIFGYPTLCSINLFTRATRLHLIIACSTNRKKRKKEKQKKKPKISHKSWAMNKIYL